ncbi:hypothetical protein bcgnr5369_43960 [Bacillus cereus]
MFTVFFDRMGEKIETVNENKQIVPQSGVSLNDKDIDILKNILLEGKNILVVGDKRTGKTTILRSIINILDSSEKLLVFDDYNEIDISEREGMVFKIGFNSNSDIIGDQTKIHPHMDMIAKGLLLPFDRVIADELFPREVDSILNALHGKRSGIFSVSFDGAENALKHIYSKTMYPSNKVLSPDTLKIIKDQFRYCVTVNKTVTIEKIDIKEDTLLLEKIN